MIRLSHATLLTLLTCAILTGCSDSAPPQEREVDAHPVAVTPPAQDGSAQALWDVGTQILDQSVQASEQLHSAINTLLATPEPANLLAAQTAWHQAAYTYQEFSMFAHLQAQNSVLFDAVGDYHYRIAAHPVQPGYLDAFGDYQYSGIVHDISMPINKETLINQHGMTDLEDAALGFYAIEYMLFGYQNTRTAKDYLVHTELTSQHQNHGYRDVTETPSARRRLLLQQQNDILREDIRAQLHHWRSPALSGEWLTLAPREHYTATASAFRQATSILLLEVIGDAKEQNEEEQANGHSTLQNSRIKMSLASLNHALSVFPENVSAPLSSALSTSIEAAESNRQGWHKTVYEQLMILSTADLQLQ